MSELKTLREVAGLGQEPGALRQSALVMIDCQNTYRTGVMQLAGVEPALDEAARLLARARALAIPIIHIQHDAGPGSPYDVRAEIGAIADKVEPRGGEPVIVKNFPNSFVQTDLHERLQKLGVSSVVLAGFMTHICVNSTARGAFNLGYRPTVVAAATATRALPTARGGVVSAAALQEASLATIGDLFGVIVAGVDELPD
ncbi:MAG TPA: isochorismatase family protein [Pseudomonadota bacterium]|nr:isochorismatase family protein [Pseudomonadota bacterium]